MRHGDENAAAGAFPDPLPPGAHGAADQVVPIPGFDGYRISSSGTVESGRGCRKGIRWHPLNPRPNRKGYLRVALSRGGRIYDRPIHRLVLEAFVGPRPPGMECRHLDGNPSNNRLGNLRWGTIAENMADAVRHGTAQKGEQHHSAKLTEERVYELRCWAATGMTQKKLAKKFGVSRAHIVKVISARCWKDARRPFPED